MAFCRLLDCVGKVLSQWPHYQNRDPTPRAKGHVRVSGTPVTRALQRRRSVSGYGAPAFSRGLRTFVKKFRSTESIKCWVVSSGELSVSPLSHLQWHPSETVPILLLQKDASMLCLSCMGGKSHNSTSSYEGWSGPSSTILSLKFTLLKYLLLEIQWNEESAINSRPQGIKWSPGTWQTGRNQTARSPWGLRIQNTANRTDEHSTQISYLLTQPIPSHLKTRY